MPGRYSRRCTHQIASRDDDYSDAIKILTFYKYPTRKNYRVGKGKESGMQETK